MAKKILFLNTPKSQETVSLSNRCNKKNNAQPDAARHSDSASVVGPGCDNTSSLGSPAVDIIHSAQPGPFRLFEKDLRSTPLHSDSENIDSEDLLPHEKTAALRHYECPRYQVCLNICAALDWEGFSCACCCGEINERLLWRAQGLCNKDKIIKAICELPDPRERAVEGQHSDTCLRLVVDNTSVPENKNDCPRDLRTEILCPKTEA